MWRIAQISLTVLLVAVAGWQLWSQWTHASRADLRLDVHIGWLVLASLVVFATYLLLIETWRQVLRRMGGRIAYGPAARVWFASNLGKYVPGKIWTVSALIVMVAGQGVPVAVAGASAVVITIAQLATGFAVVILTSLPTVQQVAGGTTAVAITTVGMAVCLAAAPLLARQWNRVAVRFGREQLQVAVPYGAVIVALGGCAVSWFLYGAAFQLLVRSILGTADGPARAYTAAYAASYLFGYLALFAPGGIGARELALTTVLPPLGLATPAQAAVITVVSRLWLTVVELIPSLIAATRTAARSSTS